MPELYRFQLRILGQNFEIPIRDSEDATELHLIRGFVTTRWVEAPSPLHAAKQAFDLVRGEIREGHELVQPSGPQPNLTVIGVWEVESFDRYPAPGKGFSFFSDTSTTAFQRLRDRLRQLWYRTRPSARPWTYSEPF